VLGDLAQDAQAAGVDHAVKLTNTPRNVYSLLRVAPATMRGMPARSAALLVLVAAVWGVNFVLIHVGLDHYPPLLFNALRFTCMALPAVFLVGRPRVPWKWVLSFGFLLGVVKFGLLFISLDLGMPPGLSSLLLQVQVIFTVAIAGVVLSERPRREQLTGGAVAFTGLIVIGIDRAASAPILPFLLVVAAALAWGVTNTISRVAQPPDALAMLVWASLVPPIPLFGLSLLFEGPGEVGAALASTDLAGLGALAFVAFAAGLFGFAAWTAMLKRHSAASVTPFALLVPVFGMGSAALFLGERPGGVELIGGAVVLLGVLLTLRPSVSAAPRAASSAPVSAAAS
jgi:O-acetylserine/cysteine efflux transporter